MPHTTSMYIHTDMYSTSFFLIYCYSIMHLQIHTRTCAHRQLFTTCYMSSSNSSSSTHERAQRLAAQVGSTHVNLSIDDMVEASTSTFIQTSQQVPKFTVHGGSRSENLALQNVQSRCRMVLAYLYAQLTPWSHGE